MKELNVEDMAVAPSVVETIVSIAASEVAGVASVGSSAASGLRGLLSSKPATQGIEVNVNEEGGLELVIRVEVLFGYSLPVLADNIRTTVADALATQVGIGVSKIDIYVDGIHFAA